MISATGGFIGEDVFLVCAGVCLCACMLSVLRRGAAD